MKENEVNRVKKLIVRGNAKLKWRTIIRRKSKRVSGRITVRKKKKRGWVEGISPKEEDESGGILLQR